MKTNKLSYLEQLEKQYVIRENADGQTERIINQIRFFIKDGKQDKAKTELTSHVISLIAEQLGMEQVEGDLEKFKEQCRQLDQEKVQQAIEFAIKHVKTEIEQTNEQQSQTEQTHQGDQTQTEQPAPEQPVQQQPPVQPTQQNNPNT